MGVRVRHHSKSGQSSSLSVKAVGGMSSGRIVTSDLAKYPYIGSNVAITYRHSNNEAEAVAEAGETGRQHPEPLLGGQRNECLQLLKGG